MDAAHWRSGAALLIDPATGSLPAELGLGPEQAALFGKWLKLAQARHRDMRWEKLAQLAPALEIPARDGAPSMRLIYRKVAGPDGTLKAIAVFAVDAAQSQAMARQLEEERERHHLEIRDFLALSANPPETIRSFFEDAVERVEICRPLWDGRGADRAEAIAAIFRDLHMIKGNAGAFGFDGLAASAQQAEDLLEALKQEASPGEALAGRLAAALAGLETRILEMSRALRLISGEGQDAMARILKWKLDRLQGAAVGFDMDRLDPRTRHLVDLSRRLPFLTPAYLARKYRHLVERLAGSQGKQARLRVIANTGDIHPESFSRVDEALVHILRNMVDHGIEPAAERAAAGKGEAVIEIDYLDAGDKVTLRIKDDGRGMDPGAIAERALSLKLVSREDVEAMTDEAKLALVFREGFTTRGKAGLVSGRGLGLALAARCAADVGGTLTVAAAGGKGTVFTLELPPLR